MRRPDVVAAVPRVEYLHKLIDVVASGHERMGLMFNSPIGQHEQDAIAYHYRELGRILQIKPPE